MIFFISDLVFEILNYFADWYRFNYLCLKIYMRTICPGIDVKKNEAENNVCRIKKYKIGNRMTNNRGKTMKICRKDIK